MYVPESFLFTLACLENVFRIVAYLLAGVRDDMGQISHIMANYIIKVRTPR